MGIIATIVIGLVIGAVAKLLLPGRDPGGMIVTILVGIAGSMLATYIGQAMGMYEAGEPAGFVGGVIGAIILLIAYRLLLKRR